MTTDRRCKHVHLGLLLVVLMAWTPIAVLGQATPAGPAKAIPTATTRSVVWDAIDLTVALNEDSSVHVTERDRVDFHGGPFRSGYREIPLARIDKLTTITVGEITADGAVPYREVSPSAFLRDVPRTYTYRTVGPVMRIDWSFPPTTDQTRTFQLAFDAEGVLRTYPEAAHPYQQLSWIAVGSELTQSAPVNAATLTIILPAPVDPGQALVQGPGGDLPEDHSKDGQTWTWHASNLRGGMSLAGGLRFPSLVAARKPSWQEASDRQERAQAGGQAVGTPIPPATPTIPARADETAQALTVAHLAAGTLAEGETALAAMAASDPTNADAQLGLGVIRFMQAIEHLSQRLYRYGLKPPESFMAPVVRLPVPENPNPQPLTYDDFRQLLQAYVDDLALAETTLAAVGPRDVELVLDLKQVRYDGNGDGQVTDDERLIAIVARISGTPEQRLPTSLTFAYDTGDVYWLRAYCHALMAVGEFFLAYDWHESFDASFFHLFPAMQSAFRDALSPPSGTLNDEIAPLADLISFLHIRWPVSEPTRLAAVRSHLKQTVALSRQSWQAIETETDNDREWLPNANQTSPFILVDAARIAAWRQVLDEADAILDGKKLVPHWRFTQGVNLRRVFDEPRPFDLILWITGPAALPYLEDGPISTPEDWARMTEAFQGRFGLFAIWVN